MAVNPTVKLELSLEDPADTPVWIDISEYVLLPGIQTNRGRNSELERFQAGTASVTLNNNDARFDPTHGPVLVNLIRNPSVETNTTDWSALLGSISRVAGESFVGSWSVRCTTTNVSESGVNYNPGAGQLLVTVGQQYTWSVYLNLENAGSKPMRMRLRWLNSGGGLVVDDNQTFTLSSQAYVRQSITASAPATAVRAELRVITNGVQGIFDFNTDAWQFEQAATASAYCDGDQAGCDWTGTAHASASQRDGSPYYPNLRAMNRIREIVTWAAVDYPVFDGYVDGWTPEYPGPNESVVNLKLTDAFSILAISTINQVRPFTEDNANNLLRNPSAEDSLEDYVANASTITLTTARAHSGKQSILVNCTNVDDSGVTYDRDTNIRVLPGRPYTFSLWVSRASATTKNMELQIAFRDAGNLVNTVSKFVTLAATTDWQRVFVCGIPDAGADRADLRFWSNGAQGAFDLYVDAWQFEQASTNLGELPEEQSNIRLGRILDVAGWPSGDRTLSTGASTLLPQTDLVGASVLTYGQQIEKSENGRLWITKDGKVKFLSRWDMGQAPYTTAQATFGQTGSDLRYVDLIPSYDLTYIRNDVRLTGTMEHAIEQVASDAVSDGHYRHRPLTESSLLVTDNELRDAANYILDRYKDARMRFVALELSPGLLDPDVQWPEVLGLELSDRITVKFTPPGRTTEITQDCFVEGIRHNWTRSGAWRTTLSLSAYGIGYEIYPAGKTFFTVGTSALTTGTGVLVY